MFRSLFTLLVVWSACTAPAHAQSISVYSNESCLVNWSIDMTPPGPYSVFVRAVMGGAVQGITAAEFRLVGFPSGWQTVAVPAASATAVLGDPTLGGTTMGFPTCQSTLCTTLFEILVFPTTFASGFVTPVRREPPSNSQYLGPVLVLCDAPVYTAVVVPGGTLCINRDCDIPVTATAWSKIKELFR